MRSRCLIFILALGLIIIWQTQISLAQTSPQIAFNSLTASYYLSRDSNGHSLLTTHETIDADFGSSGDFGITRSIPETYQNHSVNVKIISVTDAAGVDIAYKTSKSGDNLVITTGNPSIALFGPQTFKLNYQTGDVININERQNQFLLDVNGRGWNQSIGRIGASLYLPNNLIASVIGKPSCYLALNQTTNNNCQISNQSTPQYFIITAKSGEVLAHQALVVKTDFKTATFTKNQQGFWASNWVNIVLSTAAILIIIGWLKLRYLK